MALTRAQAIRASKIAVLNSLAETAASHMREAGYAHEDDHHDCVTQALADNELKDRLARQWRLVEVER